MSARGFPRVRLVGTPGERGFAYGLAVPDRIRRSVEIYAGIFKYYAGWDWETVVAHAARYEAPLEAYRPRYLEELQAIAEGSGVAFADLLAINARTEIMNAAVARSAAAGESLPPPAECTCITSLPSANARPQTLIGQNWDWKPATSETVIVLEVAGDDLPPFVTVVEAGLLAKTGMNAAGIGLTTNAMVTDRDSGEAGVPYHAILRAILESQTLSGAIFAITHQRRASAANYMIAHREGEAVDVEAAPGDFSQVQVRFPEGGTFAHTNHFLSEGGDFKDVGLWNGPDSLVRHQRMIGFLGGMGGEAGVEAFQDAFRDHFNFPYSICCHPDESLPPEQQYASVASILMDLGESKMWLAPGNPCESPYEELDYSVFFSRSD